MSNPPRIPPASDTNFSSVAWQRFFRAIQDRVVLSGQILWSQLVFTGSNLTDLATRNHADLQNINTATYTHLSSTNHTDLTDGGATTLHKHSHAGMDTLAWTSSAHTGTANRLAAFGAAGAASEVAYEELAAASAACTGAITTSTGYSAILVGKVVTVRLPAVQGTASAVTSFVFGTALPTNMRPSATIGIVCAWIYDNGARAASPGVVSVSTAGVITIYKEPSLLVAFTAAATAGLQDVLTFSFTTS